MLEAPRNIISLSLSERQRELSPHIIPADVNCLQGGSVSTSWIQPNLMIVAQNWLQGSSGGKFKNLTQQYVNG